MTAIEVSARVELTPEQIAESFWNLGSDDQARFYAHLHRTAGPGTLCMQSAWIVQSIRDMADAGDTDAREGFQKLHFHSADYVSAMIDDMHWRARRGIAELVAKAKGGSDE